MTKKEGSEQVNGRGRAVWLARLPAGYAPAAVRHSDGRFEANRLARREGADIVGEFLLGSSEEVGVPEHVWREVLDFLQHLRADVLVVLRPGEIAPGFDDYAHVVEGLDGADIRLVLPEPTELLKRRLLSNEAREAA